LKKLLLAVLIAAFSVGLFSCSSSVPTVKKSIAIPVDRILKRIEANRRKIKSFYGSGILKIDSKNFGAKASFEVLIKKPDSIKISVFGPFGLDVGELLVTKNNYKFYDAIKNKLYSGKDRSKILRKIFKLNFNFGDIIDAFAGAVNLSDKLNSLPSKADETDEFYYFTYGSKNKNAVYKINKSELTLNEYSLVDEGEKILNSKYSDFSLISGLKVPYKVNLNYLKEDGKVVIDYRNIKINRHIESMDILVPQDAERIRL